MPAVLVEVGFLSNPAQEQALASDALQNDIAQALVAAIVRYRDGGDAQAVPLAGTGGQ
jgi:N-acetylmuramoyl-L-alanine amidase